MAVSVLISELLARKEPWKLFFNVGNYTLSVLAAWAVLSRGTWPTTDATDVHRRGTWDWSPCPGSSITWSTSPWWPGLAEDQTWWESFTEDFWFYTVSTGAVLALSPLVAVVAIHPRAWVLLPLLLPPLLAVQRTAQMSQERERLAQTASIRPCTTSSPACPTRRSWPIGSRLGS